MRIHVHVYSKPFITGLHVYIILLHSSFFEIHSIFNIEEHVLQIANTEIK